MRFMIFQVLWLHGPNQEVTEVGAMNFFVYWTNEEGEKELITSPLNGVILPGITRKSLLDLAHKWVGDQFSNLRIFVIFRFKNFLNLKIISSMILQCIYSH